MVSGLLEYLVHTILPNNEMLLLEVSDEYVNICATVNKMNKK